jgi:hypothetical protein
MLLLSARKGLLILTRSGSSWDVVHEYFPGVPFSYAAVDPRTGTLWACADHGHWSQKLYRAERPGAEMKEVPAPTYPESAVIYNDGAEAPARLSYLWTVTPGGADQPDTLYIGTEPGGVFRSDDGGNTFYLLEGLWNHPSRQNNWFGGGRDQAGACSIMVDPRNSDYITVGISAGGIFMSTDGGKTWEGRNRGLRADFLPEPYSEYGHDAHCTVACPSAPDALWQQNHCGVFRTVDAGKSWTDVSQPDGPIRFGFPISVDALDPDTAWTVPGASDDRRMAVGGALFVGRTEDGGKTWTALRNGLPQKNCYDIVLRHALDVCGDRIAFGTTTGNVFLSDSRGDVWQSLGYFFPPIYAVRFA